MTIRESRDGDRAEMLRMRALLGGDCPPQQQEREATGILESPTETVVFAERRGGRPPRPSSPRPGW